MTQRENLMPKSVDADVLAKHVLVGAGIALAFISFFLLQVNHPNPNWGKLWMVRPLMIVPMAGGAGGACFYFINNAFIEKGWKKTFAFIFSLVVYLVGCWMGFVLGLAGTLWN